MVEIAESEIRTAVELTQTAMWKISFPQKIQPIRNGLSIPFDSAEFWMNSSAVEQFAPASFHFTKNPSLDEWIRIDLAIVFANSEFKEITRSLELHILEDLPLQVRTRTQSGVELELVGKLCSSEQVVGVMIPAIAMQSEESRRLDSVLLQQEKMLIASAKMSALGEMAGGIAHEVNTPLAVILARADSIRTAATLISNGSPAENLVHLEKIQKGSEVIERNCNRISKIIQGLRSFSRNSDQDPLQTVDLTQVIDDALTLCSEKARAKGVEIQWSKPDGTFLVNGRASQLGQVCLNLLQNALDAVAELPEKWISIRLHSDDDKIRLQFMDSGKGIPESIRDRIMDPFFTTKGVGKGTGLGLSISRTIIEEHCGVFTYQAESKNTAFLVQLPKKNGTPR